MVRKEGNGDRLFKSPHLSLTPLLVLTECLGPQVQGIENESQWSQPGTFCDSCQAEMRENASKTSCFAFMPAHGINRSQGMIALSRVFF